MLLMHIIYRHTHHTHGNYRYNLKHRKGLTKLWTKSHISQVNKHCDSTGSRHSDHMQIEWCLNDVGFFNYWPTYNKCMSRHFHSSLCHCMITMIANSWILILIEANSATCWYIFWGALDMKEGVGVIEIHACENAKLSRI